MTEEFEQRLAALKMAKELDLTPRDPKFKDYINQLYGWLTSTSPDTIVATQADQKRTEAVWHCVEVKIMLERGNLHQVVLETGYKSNPISSFQDIDGVWHHGGTVDKWYTFKLMVQAKDHLSVYLSPRGDDVVFRTYGMNVRAATPSEVWCMKKI